jgi:branched-chain amino acid transport system ATP-binding protein
LKELRTRRGGFLSGGEQQMLTIARSLMANPTLLLLDEPSEGLAPLIVASMRNQIDSLRREGLSILLAEQSLDFVLSLSDRVYILEKGEVKFTGTAEEVRGNQALSDQYLTV